MAPTRQSSSLRCGASRHVLQGNRKGMIPPVLKVLACTTYRAGIRRNLPLGAGFTYSGGEYKELFPHEAALPSPLSARF